MHEVAMASVSIIRYADMQFMMHYCPLVDLLINPPEVSSAAGAGWTDSHTVHQVAVAIRSLTIASQK